MSSRLNMPLETAKNFINLEPSLFKEDGKTIVPFESLEDFDFFKDYVEECPIESLVAGYHIEERFTESIKTSVIDNLLFVYAVNDKQVGRLSTTEINFLKQRKSKIIEIPNTVEDGHSAPIQDALYTTQISDFIKL